MGTSDERLASAVRSTESFQWDGSMAVIEGRSSHGEVFVEIDDEVPRKLLREPVLDWLPWQLCDAPSGVALNDLLMSATAKGPVLDEHGQTHWHIRAPWSDFIEYEVVAKRGNSGPYVAEVHISYFDSTGLTSLRHEFFNAPSASCPLGTSATILKSRMANDVLGAHWTCQAFWLLSRNEESSEHYHPMISGMHIWDDRLRTGYTVGENLVELDGRLLWTARPLNDQLGQLEINNLVGSGVFVDEFQAAALADTSPGRSLQVRGILAAGLSGVLLTLGFMIRKIRRRIRQPEVIASLLALILINACKRQQEADGSLPSLAHDFGSVYLDDGPVDLQCEFRLVNEKQTPIKITKIVTSCGCTSASADHTTLASNEEARISVSLRAAITGLMHQTACV
jgi:hypothetical protein